MSAFQPEQLGLPNDQAPTRSLHEKRYLEHVKKLVLPISALRIFNKLHG